MYNMKAHVTNLIHKGFDSRFLMGSIDGNRQKVGYFTLYGSSQDYIIIKFVIPTDFIVEKGYNLYLIAQWNSAYPSSQPEPIDMKFGTCYRRLDMNVMLFDDENDGPNDEDKHLLRIPGGITNQRIADIDLSFPANFFIPEETVYFRLRRNIKPGLDLNIFQAYLANKSDVYDSIISNDTFGSVWDEDIHKGASRAALFNKFMENDLKFLNVDGTNIAKKLVVSDPGNYIATQLGNIIKNLPDNASVDTILGFSFIPSYINNLPMAIKVAEIGERKNCLKIINPFTYSREEKGLSFNNGSKHISGLSFNFYSPCSVVNASSVYITIGNWIDGTKANAIKGIRVLLCNYPYISNGFKYFTPEYPENFFRTTAAPVIDYSWNHFFIQNENCVVKFYLNGIKIAEYDYGTEWTECYRFAFSLTGFNYREAHLYVDSICLKTDPDWISGFANFRDGVILARGFFDTTKNSPLITEQEVIDRLALKANSSETLRIDGSISAQKLTVRNLGYFPASVFGTQIKNMGASGIFSPINNVIISSNCNELTEGHILFFKCSGQSYPQTPVGIVYSDNTNSIQQISFWIHLTANNFKIEVFDTIAEQDIFAAGLTILNNGDVYLLSNADGTTILSNKTLSTHTWHHIYIDNRTNVVTYYVDGDFFAAIPVTNWDARKTFRFEGFNDIELASPEFWIDAICLNYDSDWTHGFMNLYDGAVTAGGFIDPISQSRMVTEKFVRQNYLANNFSLDILNQTTTGISRIFSQNEPFSFGVITYLNTLGVMCRASHIGTIDGCNTVPACGFSLGSGNFLLFGEIRNDSWSWTPGQVLYLGQNGDIISNIPTSLYYVIQIIGIALNSNKIFFFPQQPTLFYHNNSVVFNGGSLALNNGNITNVQTITTPTSDMGLVIQNKIISEHHRTIHITSAAEWANQFTANEYNGYDGDILILCGSWEDTTARSIADGKRVAIYGNNTTKINFSMIGNLIQIYGCRLCAFQISTWNADFTDAYLECQNYILTLGGSLKGCTCLFSNTAITISNAKISACAVNGINITFSGSYCSINGCNFVFNGLNSNLITLTTTNSSFNDCIFICPGGTNNFGVSGTDCFIINGSRNIFSGCQFYLDNYDYSSQSDYTISNSRKFINILGTDILFQNNTIDFRIGKTNEIVSLNSATIIGLNIAGSRISISNNILKIYLYTTSASGTSYGVVIASGSTYVNLTNNLVDMYFNAMGAKYINSGASVIITNNNPSFV